MKYTSVMVNVSFPIDLLLVLSKQSLRHFFFKALENKHKKMKTLHCQTQKEQKSLEERLTQEEVWKEIRSQVQLN